MDLKLIRLGVVGGGKMGANHMRVASLLKDIELVAVVDADIGRARRLATTYHCDACDDYHEIIDRVDAVILSLPPNLHAAVGAAFLARGVHCLIEKPMATDEAECAALMESARQGKGRILVGHIERFNPAVRQLSQILNKENVVIHAIDVRRMSGTSDRAPAVDVVLDLMLHDLDVILSITRSPISRVMADGVGTDERIGKDYVSALLRFENGAIATVTASRISQNKERRLNLTTDVGHMDLDFVTQELLIYRQSALGGSNDQGSYFLDLAVDKVLVRTMEPLVLEHQHFIDVVRGEAVPLIGAEAARDVLRVAWRIQGILSEAGD